ncbi:MAG: hypothetical protein N2116_06245, partial [Armatimonadetes bacterium]|nr:hypothetical protein [Armatimonadota bacterium]
WSQDLPGSKSHIVTVDCGFGEGYHLSVAVEEALKGLSPIRGWLFEKTNLRLVLAVRFGG